jgi:hypothetical protein
VIRSRTFTYLFGIDLFVSSCFFCVLAGVLALRHGDLDLTIRTDVSTFLVLTTLRLAIQWYT